MQRRADADAEQVQRRCRGAARCRYEVLRCQKGAVLVQVQRKCRCAGSDVQQVVQVQVQVLRGTHMEVLRWRCAEDVQIWM